MSLSQQRKKLADLSVISGMEAKLVSGLQISKAILCEKDSYLLELVRYIHLNPVRLKMMENPLPISGAATAFGNQGLRKGQKLTAVGEDLNKVFIIRG